MDAVIFESLTSFSPKFALAPRKTSAVRSPSSAVRSVLYAVVSFFAIAMSDVLTFRSLRFSRIALPGSSLPMRAMMLVVKPRFANVTAAFVAPPPVANVMLSTSIFAPSVMHSSCTRGFPGVGIVLNALDVKKMSRVAEPMVRAVEDGIKNFVRVLI